jgi:hypothetical protein
MSDLRDERKDWSLYPNHLRLDFDWFVFFLFLSALVENINCASYVRNCD